MKEEWPFLIGDTSTYPQCQELARDARTAGAEAMLCPSARRENGTTSPVFILEVLSDATILGVVVIQLDENGSMSAIRN
jgi:hypothetical protein